jgi:hypothetical protein
MKGVVDFCGWWDSISLAMDVRQLGYVRFPVLAWFLNHRLLPSFGTGEFCWKKRRLAKGSSAARPGEVVEVIEATRLGCAATYLTRRRWPARDPVCTRCQRLAPDVADLAALSPWSVEPQRSRSPIGPGVDAARPSEAGRDTAATWPQWSATMDHAGVVRHPKNARVEHLTRCSSAAAQALRTR